MITIRDDVSSDIERCIAAGSACVITIRDDVSVRSGSLRLRKICCVDNCRGGDFVWLYRVHSNRRTWHES